MIVKVIGNKQEKTFKINPISGTVEIVNSKSADKTVFLLPAEKTTFRIYKFPFKDRVKVKKAIEGDIKLNPLLKDKDVLLKFFFLPDKTTTVAFITLKEEIEKIVEKNYSLDSIDSEAAALLRVLFHKKVKNGNFYYKLSDGSYFTVVFNNGSLERINILNSIKYLENIEPITLDNIPQSDIPLFGSALQFLENMEINFLKDDEDSFEIPLIKSALSLSAALLILTSSFFIRGNIFKSKIDLIKKTEEELFKEKVKGIPPVDPFTQIKGLIGKTAEKATFDAADILSKVGNAKPSGIKIHKISVSNKRIYVEGISKDIAILEKFSKNLKEMNVKVAETVKTAEGVRFKMEGAF